MPVESLPSRIVSVTNLREPNILDSTGFYYNYYTKAEAGPVGSSNTLDFIALTTENFDNNEDYPRYVKVDFDIPNSTMDTNISQYTAMDKNLIQSAKDIIDNGQIRLDSILSEGGMSNFYFSGFNLYNGTVDLRLFETLTAAGIITDETFDNSTHSPQDIAENFKNRLRDKNSDSYHVFDPELLQDFISDLSKQKIKTSNNIENRRNSATVDASVSVGLSNLFIDDILKSAMDDTSHIFSDELKSVVSSNHSKNIQDKAINLVTDGIASGEYTSFLPDWALLNYYASDISLSNVIRELNSENDKNAAVQVGYIIEKVEVFGNEVTKFPIFISSVGSGDVGDTYQTGRSFVDPNVRYGARYHYSIRSIYCVLYEFFNDLELEPDLSQYYKGVFLISSKKATKEVHCVEKVNPRPPVNLKFSLPQLSTSNIFTLKFSWRFPINPQKDIKGFQVFRRENINEPFTLLAEYDFNDSLYRPVLKEVAPAQDMYRIVKNRDPVVIRKYYDKDFTPDKEYIYAVASVDAHGLTSNLSSQMMVKYNTFKQELSVSVLSKPNAPKAYPNIFINRDLFEDKVEINNKKRMTLYFNPDHSEIYKVSDQGNQIPLNLIAKTSNILNLPTYKINFVNVDLQKNNTLDIKIFDNSTPEINIDGDVFDPNNFSFDLIDPSAIEEEE